LDRAYFNLFILYKDKLKINMLLLPAIIYAVAYAFSPCCAISNPISSSLGVTLIPPGHTMSITFNISSVKPNAYAILTPAPKEFIAICM